MVIDLINTTHPTAVVSLRCMMENRCYSLAWVDEDFTMRCGDGGIDQSKRERAKSDCRSSETLVMVSALPLTAGSKALKALGLLPQEMPARQLRQAQWQLRRPLPLPPREPLSNLPLRLELLSTPSVPPLFCCARLL